MKFFEIKNLNIKVVLAVCLVCFSCNTTKNNPVNELSDNHSSKLSLDWAGVYHGTLPCVDCEGIEIRLVLKSDETFEKLSTYKGKENSNIFEDGTFAWDDIGNVVILQNQTESVAYKVAENYLLQLDSKGDEIKGALASQYQLVKNTTDPLLENKKWQLVELNGRLVENENGFITFNQAEGRFYGNNTCNNFFGQYEIKEANLIIGGQVGSTKMACFQNKFENDFMALLNQTINYSIKNNSLIMHAKNNKIVAKFLSVD